MSSEKRRKVTQPEVGANYKIISEGTDPSYRDTLKSATMNVALRVGLGYKKTQLIVLDELRKQQFQRLEK